MQIKLRRANLAGPSVRSSVAIRLISKLISRHRAQSSIHDSLLEAVRITRASHTFIAPVRFRAHPEIEPGNQYPQGHALGTGLVQPIFSPPSRRSPSMCCHSLSRHDAGPKMLCIMMPQFAESTKLVVFKGTDCVLI